MTDRLESQPVGSRPATRVLVIKLGGRVQSDERLPGAIKLAADSAQLIVVHGGGDELSTLQRKLGITPVFRDGRRVTTAEDLELVRMVLSGSANKRLVAALTSVGLRAVGISGEDGPTLLARPLDIESFGSVGTPSAVDTRLLDDLMAASWIPVVSPLARHATALDGGALNVNGDDAAAALAAAVGADELLFVADVEGVLENGVVIAALDADTIARLVATGAASAGMIAKLEAAQAALDGGVARVRIGDLAAIADPSRGTVVVRESAAVRS